jgi:hypothetical protein
MLIDLGIGTDFMREAAAVATAFLGIEGGLI